MKIRFRDLSWVLKIATSVLLIDAAYYVCAFMYGFINAL